jgi:RNA polymerase sigma factor (TIGR02999 family)
MASPLPSQPDGTPNDRPAPAHGYVTELLAGAQRGDSAATEELFPIVYEELRRLAAGLIRDEGRAHTLQATALVHEAYMRLVGPEQTPWENRAHFFGAAAQAIRRILIDHARSKLRIKRGSGAKPIPLEDSLALSMEAPESLIDLDRALARLAEISPHKAKVVELRFFAGLTVEQTALAMQVSPSTVARDWQFARVWLHRELEREASEGA